MCLTETSKQVRELALFVLMKMDKPDKLFYSRFLKKSFKFSASLIDMISIIT